MELVPFSSVDECLIHFSKSDGRTNNPHYARIIRGLSSSIHKWKYTNRVTIPGKVKPMVENREDAPVFRCGKRPEPEEEEEEEEPEGLWHSGDEYPSSPPPSATPTLEPYEPKVQVLDTSVGRLEESVPCKELAKNELTLPPPPKPMLLAPPQQQPLCPVSPSVVNVRPSVGAGGCEVAAADGQGRATLLSAAGWVQRMKKGKGAGMSLCLLFRDWGLR